MNPQDRLALIDAANRAPSVHNIQPARFRFLDERTVELVDDPQRRLLVGDPEGKDNQKSLGAALEGLSLALSERGLGAEVNGARVQMVSGAGRDPLAPFAATRASYRGMFAPANARDQAALEQIATTCSDLHIIAAKDIADLASLFDDVSMEVLRAPAYRAELLSWMRLSARHPNYTRDGLNAAHMALSSIEATGAGIVLGSTAFPLLDTVGMARPLIAESSKVRSAAGVALFHRPMSEPELETGRRFYRVWLEIERAGLALCPMSVLADVPHAAERLLREANVDGRKLVTVFRIGRRPANFVQPPRVRLPAAELIVS